MAHRAAMDINSLLSPQDSPSGQSSPAQPVSPHKNYHKPRQNSTWQGMTSSPLVHHVLTPSQLREPSPQPNSPTVGPVRGTGTPPSADLQPTRQASTPGMDTLADLASMQHHQPPRSNATVIRTTEAYESQMSPSTFYPSVHSTQPKRSTPRPSYDIPMTDGSNESARVSDFTSDSLSSQRQQMAKELIAQIQQNRHAYESRVKLVRLLHQGFMDHVYPPSSPGSRGEPHTYDVLSELRTAREELDKLFAIGEDMWVEWIQDESLLARTVNERIGVMELCQRSVEEEFGSTKLWVIYGDWMLYLYNAVSEAGDSGAPNQWSEEDTIVGREVFTWQSVMDVWKKAADSTKWRINDSHLVWDRYLDLLVQDLGRGPSQEKISQVKAVFDVRLQLPHATWDQTFQAFSSFTSTHYNTNYEDIMVETTNRATEAKNIWDGREVHELGLQRTVESGDTAAEWTAFTEYIHWEMHPRRRKRPFHFELVTALYQRALLRFPTDANLWEEYIMYCIDESLQNNAPISTIPSIQRATRHCPWSGSLWSQHLLSAEREGYSYPQIEAIKHKATITGLLDAGGVDEVLKFHLTWCSYLRRRAFQADSTDEDLDVAEVGIRGAIENVEELGRQENKTVPSDPLFRLERTYIRYLSESGSWDSARETFRSLIPRHGHSWEFWLAYYTWELLCWSKFTQSESSASASRRTPNPSYATAVLKQAVRRTDLDWPEKIMTSYISHCEHYEDADELQLAVLEIRKVSKAVARRREKEAREAQEAAVANAAAAQPMQGLAYPAASSVDEQAPQPSVEDITHVGKRKRDSQQDVNGVAPKRAKAEDVVEETVAEQENVPPAVKRDRENATVVVKNLPADVKEVKIRQFFRDCGKINTLKVLPDQADSVFALIEFDTKEDAAAAQTRDQKSFEGRTISVQIGSGSTIFVTNFPPTAGEEYIRELFSSYGEIVEVRFPSLKYNTHRRFCYVQFHTSASAHMATELDGKPVGDKLKLVAKISDPTRRQDRSGPVTEGREIHISNLDWKATEDDLVELFEAYGRVETARIPRKVDGGSKGFAFVVFASKDAAEAAVAMDQQAFRSRPLRVRLSAPTGPKRQATNIVSRVGRSKSPSMEANGAAVSPSSSSHPTRTAAAENQSTASDKNARTLALLDVPDTVNDARIQAIAEPYGALVKVILRPDHQGAIIEFSDVNDAGKASLGLEGYEIIPGRKVRVGSVPEMLRMGPERKVEKIQVGKQAKESESGGGRSGSAGSVAMMAQSAAPIRRPGQPGGPGARGRRGGLGVKRGPTHPASEEGKAVTEPGGVNKDENKDSKEGTTRKSNDDFRALLEKSRTNTKASPEAEKEGQGHNKEDGEANKAESSA